MIKKFFLKRLKNYFTILMIPAFVLFIFILVMTANSRIHSIRATSQNALENMDDTFDLITANCFYQQDLMTLNPQLSLSLRKIFLFKTSNYSDYVFLNSMQPAELLWYFMVWYLYTASWRCHLLYCSAPDSGFGKFRRHWCYDNLSENVLFRRHHCSKYSHWYLLE